MDSIISTWSAYIIEYYCANEALSYYIDIEIYFGSKISVWIAVLYDKINLLLG